MSEELQKMGTTDLSTLSSIEPTLDRPSDIDPSDLAGTEDIRPDEMRLPRLAIAQGLSPQMMPGDGQYIKGLELFTMFNDLTGEQYGGGPLLVVPVKRQVTRIEFDPNDQKVPIDRDVPAGDPRLKWSSSTPGGPKDTPPRATEYVEFVCLLLRPGKAPEPIVVSIKTTNKFQRAAAERWTTFIGMRGASIYRGMYHLSSKFEKGKTKEGQETTFGVFVVKNAGFIPTEKIVDGKAVPNLAGQALLAFAKQFHEQMENKIIDIQRENDDPDAFDPAKLEMAAQRGGAPAM